MTFLNIIIVLVLLSLMIIVHEFGHWIVARKLGFQTPVFGFGLPFGGSVKLGRWKDTEFRFHPFVLGGYVAIPELGDESSEELLKELPNLKPLQAFPVWKRALVASAGVFFNILFAYLMCFIMVATIGTPSKLKEIVITDLLNSSKNAELHNIKTNSIAYDAGIKVGDIILSINNKKVNSTEEVVGEIGKYKEKEISIKIKRIYFEDSKKKFDVLEKSLTPNKDGKIGIGIGYGSSGKYNKPSSNPLMWFIEASIVLFNWTMTMVIGLFGMFASLLGVAPKGTPQVSAGDLHGIVAIVSVFAQALSIDFREIFRWSALINVNLAIINILPIPALDGGHLMFMFIEKLRGRKLADAVQQKAIQAGFVFLLALMFFAIFNDIRGIASGKFDLPKKATMQEYKENKN